MRIGLDVSGGDFAPEVNFEGLKLAMKELPTASFFLFGDKEQVEAHASFSDIDLSRVQVVHAPDQITFRDNPTRAILKKPKSSISVGLNWLSTRKIDVFSGTGNTGAMLVGSMYTRTTIRACESVSQMML